MLGEGMGSRENRISRIKGRQDKQDKGKTG
jgi:hypothetical protein